MIFATALLLLPLAATATPSRRPAKVEWERARRCTSPVQSSIEVTRGPIAAPQDGAPVAAWMSDAVGVHA